MPNPERLFAPLHLGLCQDVFSYLKTRCCLFYWCHNTRDSAGPARRNCDSGGFADSLLQDRPFYGCNRKRVASRVHLHHNIRDLQHFPWCACSALCEHIISAKYGADGWWKIIVYDNKMSSNAVQLTPSLTQSTSQLFACYCSLCQLLEHLSFSSAGIQLDATVGQCKRKLLEHFLTNTTVCGLLFRTVSVQNAIIHQLLTICSQVRLPRELQWKGSRERSISE